MARRAFSKEELLVACFEAGWYCEATGIPLVFPPALCLLERLVSCAGGRDEGPGFGYYDFRQTRWNAPLNALTFPAGDHVEAFSGGGTTGPENLQMLAGLVNETKRAEELRVVAPQDAGASTPVARPGVQVLYWPPSSCFWDAPTAKRGAAPSSRGRNGRSSDWDGMVGAFLRLYNPELPELQSRWMPRPDGGRNDRSYLAAWYETVRALISRDDELQRRYRHLEAADCLWPKPLPAAAQ